MDGQSRSKLVKAGYKIFRMRDIHPVQGDGPVILEIREKSRRGEWVLYGRYPTKAARKRAWDELMKDDVCLAEDDEVGGGKTYQIIIQCLDTQATLDFVNRNPGAFLNPLMQSLKKAGVVKSAIRDSL